MSSAPIDHELARKLLTSAADGVDISGIYNSLPVEQQQRVFAEMKNNTEKIPGLKDWIISGTSDGASSSAGGGRLKDIYQMPTGADLYNRKDEPANLGRHPVASFPTRL